jgi:hypothetical protein
MTEMLCSRFVHPWAEERRPIARPVGAPDELIGVAELARRLGVARSTVYAHSAAFGAFRLGFGPRAPLRFDYAAVLAALPTAGRRRVAPPPQGRRPTHTRAGNLLLEDLPGFTARESDLGEG